ncbi:MAG: M3 family metallopeptidase [Deltaproteobacteria bacterium]|nr:M3 family metallopeptidase [Deltaproteobacteria bacterium]
MVSNPLTERVFPIPFDRVDIDAIGPTVDALIAETQAAIDAIAGSAPPYTWDGTLGALERATERLEHAMHVVGHLENVETSPALREAYSAAQPKVSELTSRIPLHDGLWRVLVAYAATEEARALAGPRARLLAKTLDAFRRHGAELPREGKERLAAIDVELARLTLKFAQNTLDSTNAFELVIEDEARLAGLPDSARAAARESAERKGKAGHRFTLQAPSVIPALTYLDDATLRETIYRAHVARGTDAAFDNRPIVADILRLRAEKAKLLGFATFADLVLADRMAGSAARARAFVDDLIRRTEPAFEAEKAELFAFRRELEGPEAPALAPWDVGYYAEKLRRARFAFDEEALRPYFSFERVLTGSFEIAGAIYGVRFEPWQDVPTWHPSVRTYRVIDRASDEWLAGIYVDPYPRETKQGGAWMDGLLARGGTEPDRRHLGLLSTNSTPPVGDRDAELTHQDVETVFHELGHLMHHALTRAALRSQAGTNVAWDFVELPSQILENWCWEREALDRFARHVDTGERLPDALFDAMCRARTFRAASAQMRQLGFALTDLKLHTEYDAAHDGDPVAYSRAILEGLSPTPLPPDHALVASFGHLFSDPVGYAAGYYSYKWAEVLDADAFTRFKADGLLSPEVGGAFRRAILERGDEDDPAVLYRDFMGRDPELWPLLERLGLSSAGAALAASES